jgi:hypothetical protein
MIWGRGVKGIRVMGLGLWIWVKGKEKRGSSSRNRPTFL